MTNDRDILKQRLIQVYKEYQKYSSFLEFRKNCPEEISEILIKNSGLAIDVQRQGISLRNNIKTAVLIGIKMATMPDRIMSEEMEEYRHAMENILAGKDEPPEYEKPVKKYTKIQKPALPPIPPTSPLKKKRHINKGTNELKLIENLNTKILRAIKEEPQKNPYKQQHSTYFRQRIEEQYAIMQTPNPNPRKTQEQKDAYYAFQIQTLTSNARSTVKWSGLEKECEIIRQELTAEPNYDAQRLLEFYGIEMTCMKIIKKERLPDELVRIMHKLL